MKKETKLNQKKEQTEKCNNKKKKPRLKNDKL